MKLLRTLSTSRLLLLLVALAVLAAGVGAVAVSASGGSGATPPSKPLADALHDSLAGPVPSGATARITFTNNLFPSGSLGGQVGSALMSGASGRLWVTNDGRGRLELQSDAGDAQIVWSPRALSVFDASSNTVYRASLPQRAHASDAADRGGVPAVAAIEKVLNELGAHVALSPATPESVGGRPAYSLRLSPKRHGGLLGAVELAWDAARPVPLRVGVYPKGASSPVIELAVKDISYGPVAASDVDVAPPASARVVDLGGLAKGARGNSSDSGRSSVSGYDAVMKAARFRVVAPATLEGRSRQDIRLVGHGDSQSAVAVYGRGLDAIVTVERKAAGGSAGGVGPLPKVSLDGATAHELTTPLGTVLTWNRDGVSYVVAGSVPAAAAESAARALR